MRIETQDDSKFNIKKILKFFSKESSPDLESDPNLEFEADKSGMIHVRKHNSETKFLPGYGTSNFGVSSFEPLNKSWTARKVVIGGALVASGLFLATQMNTLTTYALLVRESLKDQE